MPCSFLPTTTNTYDDHDHDDRDDYYHGAVVDHGSGPAGSDPVGVEVLGKGSMVTLVRSTVGDCRGGGLRVQGGAVADVHATRFHSAAQHPLVRVGGTGSQVLGSGSGLGVTYMTHIYIHTYNPPNPPP